METPEQIELKALRDRVATLEAARAEPVKVEIEGLDGLKQWSHAVETQQLNSYYELNSTPDRIYWGWVGGLAIVFSLPFVAYLISKVIY